MLGSELQELISHTDGDVWFLVLSRGLVKEVESMLEVLLGGFLVLLGTMIGKWLEVRYTRRTRMDQILAERSVDTYARAYAYMKEIEARLTQDTLENTYAVVLNQEQWLIQLILT